MSSEVFHGRRRPTTAKVFELGAPWIVALAVIAAKSLLLSDSAPAKMEQLLSTSANVAGVAVGFLATGQALLCSITDNAVVHKLKAIDQFERLLSFFTAAISWNLVLLIATCLGYWIDLERHTSCFAVWAGIWGGSLVASWRVIDIFRRVLHVDH